MKVSEFIEGVGSRREGRIHTTLGEIEISDDATTLRTEGTEFFLDEISLGSLANLLKINPKYLGQCPPDLRATNLRYWFDYKDNANVVLETLNQSLIGFHRPDALLIPVGEIANIVSRVFDPDDEVKDIRRTDEKFHLDITTFSHFVEVPNPNRIAGRPEVGDITSGGVRILAHPNVAKAPSVGTYLHRLICANGMTSPERQGMIRLKGRTVPEILQEMEEAAQEVLSGLDDKLASYARMAEQAIPGNPASFVYQVARESQVGPRVMNRLMEHANMLPNESTLYDVQQIFTDVANTVDNYNAMTRLQTLGGELAFNTERVLHRCGSCERLFPE